MIRYYLQNLLGVMAAVLSMLDFMNAIAKGPDEESGNQALRRQLALILKQLHFSFLLKTDA